MSELFRAEHLGFTYPGQKNAALQGVDLTVEEGEFLVLCGPSGCGKTTLLRQFKTALTPHGGHTGEMYYCGEPLRDVPNRRQAAEIGFVQQSPDNQVVTDKVWHELAFGLESLGLDTPAIRRRVAEMASFFGIQDWFYREVNTLSGGQKQLLALASVMVMQPKVLILDEPTAQLDPIAATDFLQTLDRIHRELGTTVILSEQRLEEALPLADRTAVLNEGKIAAFGTPQEVGLSLRKTGFFDAMPTAMRLWASVDTEEPCPVTVQEGKAFLRTRSLPWRKLPAETIPPCEDTVLSGRELWFRYGEKCEDVIKGLNIELHRGEFFTLLGGNGTGKTTALGVLAGALTPQRGSVNVCGRIGMLPQNPQALFVKKTVREDLKEAFDGEKTEAEEITRRMEEVVALCRLAELLDRHPYDLSGGEQQRAALAKVLLLRPDILLLDEPTKGLDARFRRELARMIAALCQKGVAVLTVSHDVEFCADYAHRCALFFDGNIVTEGTPRAFFSGNCFYTTSANRMARELCPQAVSAEDVIYAIGGNLPERAAPAGVCGPLPPPEENTAAWKPKKLPLWRRISAVVSGAAVLFILWKATKSTDLRELLEGTVINEAGRDLLKTYGALVIFLFALALSVGRRCAPSVNAVPPTEKRKLSRRTRLAAGMILLCIPATLFIALWFFDNRNYYLTSLLVLLECMLPFFLIFEKRKPQARELVVLAVLCALGVAGRAVFFMLPQFKPVMALTIIAGVALGGETGFFVGALTMLVSNIFFSQGPWTPFQMFAMGIVGFLAGVLFRKGWLRRSRGALCVFGAISSLVIYGGLLNPVSALIWSRDIQWEMLLTYYITGFPADCVHAAATVFFLWIAGEPMLEIIERIKDKYGMME